MDDKDHLIEELEGKVAHLTRAMSHIDADVAGAAAKYLRRNEGGFLEFSEFLDLLVAEVRDSEREERGRHRALQASVRELVRERLEREVDALVPALKGRLADYVTLQVVILERGHAIKDHLLVKTEPYFKALSVRGDGISGSIGETPEAAYQEQRKKMACHFFGAPDLMAKLMSPRNWELAKRFEIGKPFMTDDVGGFKVDVRLVPKEVKP